MIGTPVVLSSPYAFSAGLGAVGTPADPAALRAPANEAMLVDDIQLHILGQSTVAGTWHEWDVKLGRAQLTDGFVPPALCCRIEEKVAPQTANFADRQAFLWSFPQPLYLPAGAVLQVKVKAGVANCRANVSFRGRVLPKGLPTPRVIPVPFVGTFRPPVINDAVAETAVQTFIYKSGTHDLSNPHHAPFHVRRFVMAAVGNMGNVAAATTLPYDMWTWCQIRGSQQDFPRVQLYDQAGNPIVREALHLSQICSFNRGEWQAQFDMKGQSALYAVFDQTHSIGSVPVAQGQVGIGVVGWREVPISEVR